MATRGLLRGTVSLGEGLLAAGGLVGGGLNRGGGGLGLLNRLQLGRRGFVGLLLFGQGFVEFGLQRGQFLFQLLRGGRTLLGNFAMF